MADHELPSLALPLARAVVVIGAGTMGSGISEVAATAGHRVYLRDTSAAALDRGMGQIAQSLQKRVERGRLDAAEREAILRRVQAVDAQAALADVGLVIEVIVENLDVKVSVLRQIEAEVGPDAVIATNTSSLSVTAIAARLARPERVVGMHFFNPATVLPLVEVVRGAATAPAVVQTVFDTARAWGKKPVVCGSTPGFIVNRIARPYYGEALRLLLERAATPATLDSVLRECGGFRMGPCELMDLIGHDVNFAVTQSVCAGFFDDPRYKPSLIQKELVDAGWLGRKSGKGFFDYGAHAQPERADDAGVSGPPPRSVVIEGSLGPASALAELLQGVPGLTVAQREGPGLLRVDGHALALTDGRTATERAQALGEPVVLFDLALDYASCTRVAIAAAAQADAAPLAAAVGLFGALGKQVSLLQDLPGLAVMRTVAMLVNEAADALQQGLASAEDIDAAMRQGVNYPLGPLAWGQRIGHQQVLTVLRHLALSYGEDRYRSAIWLQRQAQAARPLETAHA